MNNTTNNTFTYENEKFKTADAASVVGVQSGNIKKKIQDVSSVNPPQHPRRNIGRALCRSVASANTNTVGDRVDDESSWDDDDDFESINPVSEGWISPSGPAETAGESDDGGDTTAFRKVCNISWDTDGETVSLPTTVKVPSSVHDEDDICDYLSDEYGWCVNGFDLEAVATENATSDDFQASEKGSDEDEIIQRRDSVDSLDGFDFQYCHNDEVWEEPYVVRDIKGNIVYDEKQYWEKWVHFSCPNAKGQLVTQAVPDNTFDEWVQQLAKYKPHRREKKFKSYVNDDDGARLRVRYKKGLFKIYCPKHKIWSAAGPSQRFMRYSVLSIYEDKHYRKLLTSLPLTDIKQALIVAAFKGDDDSNARYDALLQDRIESNLTGKHTARHKYVKVNGRRGLGDGS